ERRQPEPGVSRPRRGDLTRLLMDTVRIATAEEGSIDPLEDDSRPEARALLRDAVRERASDVHLDPAPEGVQVRMRIDGVVLDGATVPAGEGDRLINQIKTLAGLNPAPSFSPEGSRITLDLDGRALDMRLTVAPCLGGDKLSLRVLEPQRVYRQLSELGLREADRDKVAMWLERLNGMFLVAGPTGSGKTTTLYALLHQLKIMECSLVTIEDPPEYEIQGISQMQVDPDRGLSFAEGIKTMLRLDPDYMLLGEIRDGATARAATDAATAGKGLMSTLHSRDAASVVTVLRNYGLNDQEISANLSVVVSQRLVRTLCPACRQEGSPTADERRWLSSVGVEPPKTVWHPAGCDSCRGVGFAGRTGVFEVWRVDDEDYTLLLEHADERTLQRHLAGKGHSFLLDDALAKAGQGVTSLGEIRTMGGFGAWSQAARLV
ncbi:MAG: ATPase, T2SS/T4P/T4SS family, partial [Chromatiales bacterium]